jgi:hypothetical protein
LRIAAIFFENRTIISQSYFDINSFIKVSYQIFELMKGST